MEIKCADFLFIHQGADFFVYDRKSAYLYPIDYLHFEVGRTLQATFQRDGFVLGVDFFVKQLIGNSPDTIREHYAFIISLFSERRHGALVKKEAVTEQDLVRSISTVPHIVVEVTEKCNFSCRYCYYGEMYDTVSDSTTRNIDMPEKDCLKCLRVLLSNKDLLYSNRSIISFYGGEPFLNFKLIKEIVIFCKKEFPDIEFQFRATTNGSLLRKYTTFLIEHDIHLLVSLDGDKLSDIHRCYRGGRQTFPIVERSINYLFEKHRDYFERNVEFISVLHRDSDIVSICQFFSRYDKTPLLTNLTPEGIVADRQSVKHYEGVSAQEMEALFDTNRSVYDLITATSRGLLPVNEVNKTYSSQHYSNLRGCYLFANKIFLSADGYVYLCEKSSRQFPFGAFVNGRLSFYLDDINRYYREFDHVVTNGCDSCAMCNLCDRCFFEGPSQMASPMKCKVSDAEMEQKLIGLVGHE